MMITFKAKNGTEFFYNPELEGEIWITAPPEAGVPKEVAVTAVIPVVDLIEFAGHAGGVPRLQTLLEWVSRRKP